MTVACLIGRRPVLKIAAGVAASGALGAGGWAIVDRDRNLFHLRRVRPLMHTSVAINVVASDPKFARRAIEAAFNRMVLAIDILNRFDPRSALSQLNREGWLANPPPAMRTVLERSLAVSAQTDGAFDVSVAPVLDYFFSLDRPVSLSDDVRRAVSERDLLVDYKSIVLAEDYVRLLRPGMTLTLNGIGKGYVVDQGFAALREAGVTDALIDAGGDLRLMATANGKRFWNVGIVDPQHTDRVAAVIQLRNAAIATSGNYEVFFTADRSLFHIINPHTGYSPDNYSSVTIVSGEAMESDCMGVAAFSMELPRLKRVMAERGDEWLLFSWDGTTRWRSKNLPLISGEARVV